MISAVNFAIVVGQLLGYGVMRETQSIDSASSYRIMYAVQWGFAGVGIALLPLIPESPMRLVVRGKEDAARSAIRRLEPADTDVEVKMAEIKAVLAHNTAPGETSGLATLKECFGAKNRLRTIIALSVFFLQASSGVAWVVGYMGYFLQLSGMEGTSVFDATVGIAGAMAIGTMSSWWAVERIGRRWTILGGKFDINDFLGRRRSLTSSFRPSILHSIAPNHRYPLPLRRQGPQRRPYSSWLHGPLGFHVPSLRWFCRLQSRLGSSHITSSRSGAIDGYNGQRPLICNLGSRYAVHDQS